ncbi:MAG: 50S ribosomal protein L15e [Nanoarchaeota archaeon]|nr:50S ribosomal protein L15e [Nanoarchaeota archaeon]
MGYQKYVRQIWKKPKESLGDLWQQRLISWRQEPSTLRLEHPTRIDRARSLGYKAKQGIIVVRQRVLRGGRMRPDIKGGRRPKHNRQRKIVEKNYQQIAEERANKSYVNCEVLNSYYVAEDGKHYWYEVILVDKAHPAVLADKDLSWIADSQHTGRVFRGLTSAGKHSRSLHQKGFGVNNARPSLRANSRRQK